MEAHQLENLRRSLAMQPPDQPAPLTACEAGEIIRQLQKAEEEVGRLRAEGP